MNLTYTIKLFCSGAECDHRYLRTHESSDPTALPRLVQRLVLMAQGDGWTKADGNALFCPQCVREVGVNPKQTVKESRNGKVGGR